MGAPPTEANPDIAQALRRARRWKGITQEALAALLRTMGATTATNTVQRWERTGSIKLDDAMLLAMTYGISLEQLAGRAPLPDTFVDDDEHAYRLTPIDYEGHLSLLITPLDDDPTDPGTLRRTRDLSFAWALARNDADRAAELDDTLQRFLASALEATSRAGIPAEAKIDTVEAARTLLNITRETFTRSDKLGLIARSGDDAAKDPAEAADDLAEVHEREAQRRADPTGRARPGARRRKPAP